MTNVVLPFRRPYVSPQGEIGRHRADLLAEQIVTRFCNESVVDVLDALVRVTASIVSVNTINRTEAIEMAELLGVDLVALVREMDEGAP